jgi:hypothetical protein
LFHSLILGCVKEYFHVAHTLAPFFLTPASSDTTSILTTLHLALDGYILFFLEDYKLDQDLKLSFNSFKLTFQHMSHLLVNGPFGMVFEHFWVYFHLKDLYVKNQQHTIDRSW